MSSTLLVGAHLPGGAARIVENARACDADVAQVFASNPRAWATPAGDAPAAAIRAGLREGRPHRLFVHAPYLINLASQDPGFRDQSAANLAWTMRRAGALGASGVVVHAGAGGASERTEALGRVREAVLRAIDADPLPEVVIELTAGGRGTVASRWPQAAEVLDVLDAHPRVRFCFDTCHAMSAGYPLDTAEAMLDCIDEMRRAIGAERLALIHANDSRDPCGSRRDRHWHIGEGTIGPEPFRALLASPAARAVPIVVETPGGLADHARNIARLRELAP